MNGERDRARARVLMEREERKKVERERLVPQDRKEESEEDGDKETEGGKSGREKEQRRDEVATQSEASEREREMQVERKQEVQVESSPFISPSPPQLVLPSVVAADAQPRSQSDAGAASGQPSSLAPPGSCLFPDAWCGLGPKSVAPGSCY